MRDADKYPLIIYDDREFVKGAIARYVGRRNFGSIRVKNRNLSERFFNSLPDWARALTVHCSPGTVPETYQEISPHAVSSKGALFISAQAAIFDPEGFRALVERLPFSDKPVLSHMNGQLFAYLPSLEQIETFWPTFTTSGLSLLETIFKADEVDFVPDSEELVGNLVNLNVFLNFITGATDMRAFNSAEYDEVTYTKKSSDKEKMRAEHSFSNIVPASMRPWLAGAYDFKETADSAQYTMRRYLYADAAFQWVHEAWNQQQFEDFLFRVLWFLKSRPSRSSSSERLMKASRALLIDKVKDRRDMLLSSEVGQVAANLLKNSRYGHRYIDVFEEYFELAEKQLKVLSGKNEVIGHGDPCLSNILYDPGTQTMLFIDPKGAVSEEQLWTIPTYDYFKLSHSILGNYDLINNLLFRIELDKVGDLKLVYDINPNQKLRRKFAGDIAKEFPLYLVRLGEASLFLSMLPLHSDYLQKVIAFWIRAREIVDILKAGEPGNYDG